MRLHWTALQRVVQVLRRTDPPFAKDADGYAFLFGQLGVTYKPLPPLKEKAK